MGLLFFIYIYLFISLNDDRVIQGYLSRLVIDFQIFKITFLPVCCVLLSSLLFILFFFALKMQFLICLKLESNLHIRALAILSFSCPVVCKCAWYPLFHREVMDQTWCSCNGVLPWDYFCRISGVFIYTSRHYGESWRGIHLFLQSIWIAWTE